MNLIDHKALFNEYLALGERPLSCYHFSSVFAWKDFFKFSFEVIDARLCVFAHQGNDSFLYLPPLGGEAEVSTVAKCFERMGESKIARVENISQNQLPLVQGHGYNSYLKAQEYLYRRQDLERLAGRVYKSKRHDIHIFCRRHPGALFRAYNPSDFQGCRALYKAWAASRQAQPCDVVYSAMLEENSRVHALLMEHAPALDLIGRVVEIDGEISGYTFGYALDAQTIANTSGPDCRDNRGKTFCILLEITDLSRTGLAAYIFNSFCRDASVKDFEFINTMDDFGMPNVAKAKVSYRPLRQLPVYTFRRENGH